MIPLVVVIACALALLTVVLVQQHKINGKRDNFRAVEAERIARKNAAPLGNVDRGWFE